MEAIEIILKLKEISNLLYAAIRGSISNDFKTEFQTWGGSLTGCYDIIATINEITPYDIKLEKKPTSLELDTLYKYYGSLQILMASMGGSSEGGGGDEGGGSDDDPTQNTISISITNETSGSWSFDDKFRFVLKDSSGVTYNRAEGELGTPNEAEGVSVVGGTVTIASGKTALFPNAYILESGYFGRYFLNVNDESDPAAIAYRNSHGTHLMNTYLYTGGNAYGDGGYPPFTSNLDSNDTLRKGGSYVIKLVASLN